MTTNRNIHELWCEARRLEDEAKAIRSKIAFLEKAKDVMPGWVWSFDDQGNLIGRTYE